MDMTKREERDMTARLRLVSREKTLVWPHEKLQKALANAEKVSRLADQSVRLLRDILADQEEAKREASERVTRKILGRCRD